MNEDLIKRIDEEIDLLRRAVVPAFRGQIELLRDCRAALERVDAPKPPCTWKLDYDTDAWDTSCGHSFVLNADTPSENSMCYCPYCGGALVEQENTDG